MRIFTKLSPISNTRTADPWSRGAEEESLFRRPRQAGRIYLPHSAYALRVQLVCPIKDESSRRTDRPQPNTHQQEQQHFYPPEGQTRTLRELYKKTIFCIIRGTRTTRAVASRTALTKYVFCIILLYHLQCVFLGGYWLRHTSRIFWYIGTLTQAKIITFRTTLSRLPPHFFWL